MPSVLILAYYFPPMGLGGVQRSLKFVKYLPAHGWRPIVVTVKDVRYYGHDPSMLDEIPETACIERTGSLDPLRLAHLTGRGEQQRDPDGHAAMSWLRRLCFPDYQAGWIPFAALRALRVMAREPVDALFTTFPPASAHVAGYLLHRLTGLPWVADFRDAWAGGEFERSHGEVHRDMMRRLQDAVLSASDHVTAVSEPIAEELTASCAEAKTVTVIRNGYDPEDFTGVEPATRDDRFVLTYCGALNAARNPEPLLLALRRLLDRRPALTARIDVRLAGASIGLDMAGRIHDCRLDGVARVLGYLSHREAIAQMLASDALTMFITSEAGLVQGAPTGKIYEYLAAGKPILGITPDGEAKRMIEASGRGAAVHPERIDEIADVLEGWIMQHERGTLPVFPVGDASVQSFSRVGLTKQLAGVLHHATRR